MSNRPSVWWTVQRKWPTIDKIHLYCVYIDWKERWNCSNNQTARIIKKPDGGRERIYIRRTGRFAMSETWVSCFARNYSVAKLISSPVNYWNSAACYRQRQDGALSVSREFQTIKNWIASSLSKCLFRVWKPTERVLLFNGPTTFDQEQ